jgi:hypothetical protein
MGLFFTVCLWHEFQSDGVYIYTDGVYIYTDGVYIYTDGVYIYTDGVYIYTDGVYIYTAHKQSVHVPSPQRFNTLFQEVITKNTMYCLSHNTAHKVYFVCVCMHQGSNHPMLPQLPQWYTRGETMRCIRHTKAYCHSHNNLGSVSGFSTVLQ